MVCARHWIWLEAGAPPCTHYKPPDFWPGWNQSGFLCQSEGRWLLAHLQWMPTLCRTKQKDWVALLLEKRCHISEPSRGVYRTFVTDNVPWLAALCTQEELPCFLIFFLLSKTISLVILCLICALFLMLCPSQQLPAMAAMSCCGLRVQGSVSIWAL